MYGWTRSTPVSSSATVTPAPEKPGIPTSGRRPPATPRTSSTLLGSTAAGIAARTGKTPFTSGSRTTIASDARVERGREAVEHAVVRVLGLDRRPVEREPGEHVALRAARRRRPGALLLLGGDAARRGDTRGERRLREHDDPAPAELRRRPVAEQALPARRASVGLVGAARSRDAQERSTAATRADARGDATGRDSRVGSGSRRIRIQVEASRAGKGSAKRAADAIIAALSVQSASGASAASGSAARSSRVRRDAADDRDAARCPCAPPPRAAAA